MLFAIIDRGTGVALDGDGDLVGDGADGQLAVLTFLDDILLSFIDCSNRAPRELGGIITDRDALSANGDSGEVCALGSGGEAGNGLLGAVVGHGVAVRGQRDVLVVVEVDDILAVVSVDRDGLIFRGYGGVAIDRDGGFGNHSVKGLPFDGLAFGSLIGRAVPVVVDGIAEIAALGVGDCHGDRFGGHRAGDHGRISGVAVQLGAGYAVGRIALNLLGVRFSGLCAILIHIVDGQQELRGLPAAGERNVLGRHGEGVTANVSILSRPAVEPIPIESRLVCDVHLCVVLVRFTIRKGGRVCGSRAFILIGNGVGSRFLVVIGGIGLRPGHIFIRRGRPTGEGVGVFGILGTRGGLRLIRFDFSGGSAVLKVLEIEGFTVVVLPRYGVGRHDHLAGGDGEVDGVVALDLQLRFIVERIVLVTRNRFIRGVDRDDVGLGIGVGLGCAAGTNFGILRFQFPHLVKIFISGNTLVGQRVVDCAAGKAGGDGVGNVAERFVQLIGIVGIECVLGIRCDAFAQEVTDLRTEGAVWIPNSAEKTTIIPAFPSILILCAEAHGVEMGVFFYRAGGFLSGIVDFLTAVVISGVAGGGGGAVRQGDDVLVVLGETADSSILQEILGASKTLLQIGAAIIWVTKLDLTDRVQSVI